MATRAAALLALVAALLAAVATTENSAPVREQTAWGPVEVSQSGPDPALEDAIPTGGDTLGAVEGATADGDEVAFRYAKGCASKFHWLGRCAIAGFILRTKCATAGCGLVGVLGSGGKRFYRADPAASRFPRGYQPAAKWILRSKKPGPGRCVWTRKKATQAAYVLARYGQTNGPNREAAAIDLATTHVLCGAKQRQWRISGGATADRLKRTGLGKGARTKVMNRARALVRQGLKQRGPYRLSVKSPRQAVANTMVTVAASLRGVYTKNPASNRKLVLSLPDTSTVTAWTNGSGVATWTFPLPPGTHKLRVRAKGLEEHRLPVKHPKNRAGSRLLIAGKHHNRVARAFSITTKNTPRLEVSPDTSGKIPAALAGSFDYLTSVGTEPKTVRFELRGGYGQASKPTCTNGITIKKATKTINANGTYSLPNLYPRVGGYYRWRVTVDGDSLNTPRTVCSKVVRLDRTTPKVPKTDMKPVAGTVFTVGQKIKPAMFRYRKGFGFGGRAVRTRLYGPFKSAGNADCSSASRLKTERKWTLKQGNSRYDLIKPGKYLRARGKGWYRFDVKVGGDVANRAAYRCGPRFRVR